MKLYAIIMVALAIPCFAKPLELTNIPQDLYNTVHSHEYNVAGVIHEVMALEADSKNKLSPHLVVREIGGVVRTIWHFAGDDEMRMFDRNSYGQTKENFSLLVKDVNSDGKTEVVFTLVGKVKKTYIYQYDEKFRQYRSLAKPIESSLRSEISLKDIDPKRLGLELMVKERLIGNSRKIRLFGWEKKIGEYFKYFDKKVPGEFTKCPERSGHSLYLVDYLVLIQP